MSLNRPILTPTGCLHKIIYFLEGMSAFQSCECDCKCKWDDKNGRSPSNQRVLGGRSKKFLAFWEHRRPTGELKEECTRMTYESYRTGTTGTKVPLPVVE